MGKQQTATSESSPLINNGHNNGNGGDVHSKIAAMRQLMQETHKSRVNFSFEWRKTQLSKLSGMVEENFDLILKAVQQDLGKNATEATVFEIGPFRAEVAYMLANTHRLMQPQDKPSIGALLPCSSKITPQPRNGPAVLVIGAYNYPFGIALMAVAGSLAAGNPTVIKPSELCPASAALLSKLVQQYFDPSVLQVVEGGIPETTALLEQDWGMIHFTGSERVGKIVATAGAKTLSPYVLELGGKCPCLVDETAPYDTYLVANRIIWSKMVNCGQNCISPDYVLVHKSKVDALVRELKRVIQEQFGSDPKQSDLGKLVAAGHVHRAIELMEEMETLAKKDEKIQILCGGSKECDVKAGYVAPTFVLNPPLDSRLMREEIFSPILPVVVVESREEAIEVINSRPGIPLGLYAFTNSDAVFQEITERCRAGGAIRNDCLVQFSGPHLPFGGLGTSGVGSYRGDKSFEVFSHMMPTMYRVALPGTDLNLVRCQPYPAWKRFVLGKVVPRLPDVPVMKNFNRAFLMVTVAVGIAKFVPGADGVVNAGRVAVAGMLQTAATAISP